jgi:hypothetical protein
VLPTSAMLACRLDVARRKSRPKAVIASSALFYFKTRCGYEPINVIVWAVRNGDAPEPEVVGIERLDRQRVIVLQPPHREPLGDSAIN